MMQWRGHEHTRSVASNIAKPTLVFLFGISVGCGATPADGKGIDGGDDQDATIVPDGASDDGVLKPGATGTSTLAMEVEGTTWYRATLESTHNASLSVFNAEPLEGENLAAQCVDSTCIVDFVTRPNASTYFLQVTNQSTQQLSYTVSASTHTIPTLILDDGTRTLDTVTGKESHYYSFEAGSADTHVVSVWADPTTTSARVGAFLYDAEGVISDFTYLTFTWADGLTGARNAEENLTAGAVYYVKIKSLPDPFEVDDELVMDYSVNVWSY